jgi:hypothetical protein
MRSPAESLTDFSPHNDRASVRADGNGEADVQGLLCPHVSPQGLRADGERVELRVEEAEQVGSERYLGELEPAALVRGGYPGPGAIPGIRDLDTRSGETTVRETIEHGAGDGGAGSPWRILRLGARADGERHECNE